MKTPYRQRNRRASFTEVEVRRVLKAAKAEGFARVELIQSAEGFKIVCEQTARERPEPMTETLE